jgi:Family of unknown function (DUF5302)
MRQEVRMAVEQSGAEESPGKPAPKAAEATDDEATANPASDPGFDELKRKFREALARKRSAHASAEGADQTGKVHGAQGPAASRRSFRRKSG